jgi:hypothetical protein
VCVNGTAHVNSADAEHSAKYYHMSAIDVYVSHVPVQDIGGLGTIVSPMQESLPATSLK